MSYRITGCMTIVLNTHTFIKEYEEVVFVFTKTDLVVNYVYRGLWMGFGWYTNMNKPEEHPPSTAEI